MISRRRARFNLRAQAARWGVALLGGLILSWLTAAGGILLDMRRQDAALRASPVFSSLLGDKSNNLRFDPRGWPVPSFAVAYRSTGVNYWLDWGIPIGGAREEFVLPAPRALPTLPWWGLPVSWTFWTGPCLVVLYARAIIRRVRGKKSSCCAVCGYDRSGLASDAPCPECGEPWSCGDKHAPDHGE